MGIDFNKFKKKEDIKVPEKVDKFVIRKQPTKCPNHKEYKRHCVDCDRFK